MAVFPLKVTPVFHQRLRVALISNHEAGTEESPNAVKKPHRRNKGKNVQKETAPCFDFTELSEALNGTEPTIETPADSNAPYNLSLLSPALNATVETPADSNAPYNFSLLSQALNAAEKDNNAKEPAMVRLNSQKAILKKIHFRMKFINTDISWPPDSERHKTIFPIMVRMMHIVALGYPARRKRSKI